MLLGQAADDAAVLDACPIAGQLHGQDVVDRKNTDGQDENSAIAANRMLYLPKNEGWFESILFESILEFRDIGSHAA